MASLQTTEYSFRIAFCIECHKYTPVLQELVDRLHHPLNDIFIHVDKRSDVRFFAALREQVHFIAPRTKVYWANFGQIDCMLRLFEQTRQGDYCYIVLLSGDTILLRSCEEIRNFLMESYAAGLEFFHTESSLDIQEIHGKLRKTHYFNKETFILHLRHIVAKLCLPTVNRYFKSLPPLEKGDNWIAFTDHFRDYIFDYLREHPNYIRAFKYSRCCDEIFFHSILFNSPFREKNRAHSLMFTDSTHSKLHPKTQSTDDLPELLALRNRQGLPCLFARKIDDQIDLRQYRRMLFNE